MRLQLLSSTQSFQTLRLLIIYSCFKVAAAIQDGNVMALIVMSFIIICGEYWRGTTPTFWHVLSHLSLKFDLYVSLLSHSEMDRRTELIRRRRRWRLKACLLSTLFMWIILFLVFYLFYYDCFTFLTYILCIVSSCFCFIDFLMNNFQCVYQTLKKML